MTVKALKRLAPHYGFRPEDWHLKLAPHFPPMAIIGLFRDAVLRQGISGVYLHFPDPLKLDCARPLLPIVARALGEPVHVEELPSRDADMGDGYLEGARKRHILRLKEKAEQVERAESALAAGKTVEQKAVAEKTGKQKPKRKKVACRGVNALSPGRRSRGTSAQ